MVILVSVDFSDLSKLASVRETILGCFSHQSEEVKTAAAYGFGSLAIGNLPAFLPALLNEMEQQPKKQYLLLHALKEVSFSLRFQVLRTLIVTFNCNFVFFSSADNFGSKQRRYLDVYRKYLGSPFRPRRMP
jgi:hypothetical protein